MISEEYREMNKALHATRPTYGAGGHRWADIVRPYCEKHIWSVLDYGCGKGTLSVALGNTVSEYDPAIPGKDGRPTMRRFVVCTDVLEHIEPEHLDEVLQDIRRCMVKEGLLVIATRPANKTLPDGRNAHLIQEPWEWWEKRIKAAHMHIDQLDMDVTQEGEFAAWVSPASLQDLQELTSSEP